MKKTVFINFSLKKLLFVLFAIGVFSTSHAQISYNFDFNANSTGWTGDFTRFTGATACGGSGGAMRRNLYASVTSGELISPLVGLSNGMPATITYDYKVMNWSANTTATAAPWGSFVVQYGPSATGPWTTFATISNETQTNNVCLNRSHVVSIPAGNAFIRWSATFQGTGDYYLNFDNIVITQQDAQDCAGTPDPGNTLSSLSNACVSENIFLSLQNLTVGAGISYQWQTSSNGIDWVNAGPNAPSWSTTQTATTFYRCIVSCEANDGISSPVQVVQNAPTACYCVPTYTSGKTDGDLISRVRILGTTLDNDTGTSPVNPAYTYFPPNPPANTTTADLVAGTTYTISVTYGSFTSQNCAVWIDFNENGVFDANERVGFTTSSSTSAFQTVSFPISLPCNPVPGTYRMRVRNIFSGTGSGITPCGNFGYGETEDYDITVLPPPPCPMVSNLTAGTPTAFNVPLNWSIGCAETAWNVEYGPVGFTPGTGTVVPAGTNSNFLLTGLSASTTYHVYVSADCDASGVSAPFGPISFTTTVAPCMGTPAASNVVSSVPNACLDQSFTLSLSQTYTDLGLTYQWQSSSDNDNWTNIAGATNATLSRTQTETTWYRCLVTCTTENDVMTSGSLQINMSLPNQCYCIPGYSSGIGSGDLISRVRVLGTTLDNETGINTVGPSYSYFTGQPNFTAELRQGTTYQLGVSIGSFASGQFMTAWIDFNEDGVFDESERLGFTTQATNTAFQEVLFPIALPNNAPLGTFRMRVRLVWNVTSGSAITPCGSFGFGEAEDYDVTIIEPITTVVEPTNCNTTINQVAYEYFNAVPVDGAQEYEFRIQNGAFTATAVSATGASRFFDFVGFEYGTTYDVSVRVKIDEAYGPFGASCPISIDAAPTTSVQSPACGSTLANIATPINAFGVPGAQMYRFEVTNTSNNTVQLLERATRNMTIPMLQTFAFGTTYSIRVQVMLNDTWLPYDAVCSLTTPPATTQLRPVSCNVTIPNPATLIYAQSVVNATNYQFEVTNTSTNAVEVISSSVPNFRLNQLAAVQLGVTYSIRVRAEVNGSYGAYGSACTVFITSPALTLRPVSCNVSLPSFATAIFAQTMAGATQYRFEFTNTTSNAVEEIDSELGSSFVRLSDLATTATFGTVYNVRVRALINGVPATAYGAVCTVTAPSPTTQLRAQECNVLLNSPAAPLNAITVSGATQYQFEVTNTTTNQVDVVTRNVRSMTLLMMSTMTVEEGTTYSIRVRAFVNGQYTVYGTACSVTTPGDIPLTQLDVTSCGGFFFPWDAITANPVANATAYRFSVTDGNQTEVVEMTENFMSGFDLVTLPFSGTYDVQVAAQVQGNWGEYGETCQITFMEDDFGDGPMRAINNPSGLAVIGYPNPFNNGFMLRISTKTALDVVVSIYDMTGKLIEVSKFNSQASQTTFGHNLPSGVYNVNVVGGNINETLKLVKN